MRAWPLLILGGCGTELLAGDWTFTLRCADGFAGVPACPGASTAFVRLSDGEAPADGRHRTLFPGGTDVDGSYAGVTGPVVSGWEGADLVLDLIASVDDPLASEADLVAWGAHRLRIIGQPGARCWEGSWAWLADDDATEATGRAVAERPGRDCP